mmetsp:Transcript_9082/g.15145  ORF Transcript_9082/g.15145 Transcript_9082/m.15145 type:complete len:103 (-) Transcript_9082:56-364(-)
MYLTLGQMRAYHFVGDVWEQLGSRVCGEAETDEFGRVALSRDGTILAVGALFLMRKQGFEQAMFEFIEDDWIQVGAGIDGSSAFLCWSFCGRINSCGGCRRK